MRKRGLRVRAVLRPESVLLRQRWREAVAVVPLYECRAAIPGWPDAVAQELEQVGGITYRQRLGCRVAPSVPSVAHAVFALFDRREPQKGVEAPKLAIFHAKLFPDPNHPISSVDTELIHVLVWARKFV
eukprot:6673176-Prymnesium_polylepis.1